MGTGRSAGAHGHGRLPSSASVECCAPICQARTGRGRWRRVCCGAAPAGRVDVQPREPDARLGGLRDERKNVLFVSEGWVPQGPRDDLANRHGQRGQPPGGWGGARWPHRPGTDHAADRRSSWCDAEIAARGHRLRGAIPRCCYLRQPGERLVLSSGRRRPAHVGAPRRRHRHPAHDGGEHGWVRHRRHQRLGRQRPPHRERPVGLLPARVLLDESERQRSLPAHRGEGQRAGRAGLGAAWLLRDDGRDGAPPRPHATRPVRRPSTTRWGAWRRCAPIPTCS